MFWVKAFETLYNASIVLLNLSCAYKSPAGQGRAQDSAFLTSSRVLLTFHLPHFD